MALQAFRAIFFAGLVPSVVILVLNLEALMSALLYAGTLQIALLTVLAFRLERFYVPLAIDTLHKAGFLHSLFAVGAAVVVSGAIIARGAFGAESLSLVLLPMGAALVPHAIGLTAGHALQMRRYEPEGEDKAELEGLRRLQRRKDVLLRGLVAALEHEEKLHHEIRSELGKQPDLLRALGGTVKEVDAAIQELTANVKRSVSDTTAGVAGAVAGLTVNAERLSREIEAASAAAQKLRLTAEEAATFLRALEKLQHVIVNIFEAEIFRKAPST